MLSFSPNVKKFLSDAEPASIGNSACLIGKIILERVNFERESMSVHLNSGELAMEAPMPSLEKLKEYVAWPELNSLRWTIESSNVSIAWSIRLELGLIPCIVFEQDILLSTVNSGARRGFADLCRSFVDCSAVECFETESGCYGYPQFIFLNWMHRRWFGARKSEEDANARINLIRCIRHEWARCKLKNDAPIFLSTSQLESWMEANLRILGFGNKDTEFWRERFKEVPDERQ